MRQSELTLQLANVRLDYTKRKLVVDFESAFQDARRAADDVNTLRSSIDLAAQSLRLTVLRYKAGDGTALEVVTAQNALAQEKDLLSDAEAAYVVAIAKLQTVTGPF